MLSLCDHCGNAPQKAQVCARCKAATYCSKDCQVCPARAPAQCAQYRRANTQMPH